MSKDKKALTTQSADVRVFDLTERDLEVAALLNAPMTGEVAGRLRRVVSNQNAMGRLAVETGYVLMSLKSDSEQGQFLAALNEAGIDPRRAQEYMGMAKFASRLTNEQLSDAMAMDKSKVMLLAQTDSDIVGDLLGGEDAPDLNALSYRQLKTTIAELKADRANALAARDKAEAEATHAAEQLQTAMNRKPSKGEKPYLVQDITAELAVYVRKAQIAIQSLNEQLVAIKECGEALDGYRDSLGSLGYASIANVFMQAASLAGWAKNEGFDQSDYSRLDLRSVHDDKQLAAARDAYVSLARLEEAETHNRKVDRQAARPKSKGAPLKAMPIAADDAALSDEA